jgi:uncharacterized protein (DUF1330 family)
MKRQTTGYAMLLGFALAFALIIYGAYSPARKAQKQRIVCVKFKKEAEKQAVEQHLHEFAALKGQIKQIVNYSAGRTILPDGKPSEYDMVHYVTFQSEADIRAFEAHPAYQAFQKNNAGSWADVLVLNADIQ